MPRLLCALKIFFRKKIALGCSAALLVLFPGAILQAAESTVQKPHVLIILADDLGWNDVGYHDSPINTPNTVSYTHLRAHET